MPHVHIMTHTISMAAGITQNMSGGRRGREWVAHAAEMTGIDSYSGQIRWDIV